MSHPSGVHENPYLRLFETSADGMLLVAPGTGRIKDANPAFLQLLGVTRDQVIDRELWQVGLLPDEPTQQAFLRQVQQHPVVRYDLLEHALHDGERCQVEWVSTAIEVRGQHVLYCILRDVTNQWLIEEASQLLAAIVSSSDDAILSKDLDGIITSWNPAAERLYGYRAQEMVGQPVIRLFPPDHQEDFISMMERIRRGEQVDHHETLRVHKDGRLVPVSVTISPIKDRSGTIIGASTIARDISQRQTLQRQREAFLSLVTHELKTPLTCLQGNLDLAQRRLTYQLSQAEPSQAEQQRTLEDILHILERSQRPLRVQQRLINDLLDLSYLQEGKLEVHLAACNLVRLVAETVQDQQAAYPTRLITTDLPHQDRLVVYADQDRLQQVLSNYLNNALKFSSETAPVQVGITLEAGEARV